MPLRGQANVQGACDLGALPNVYPGYQRVDDPVVKNKFEQAWGVELSTQIGLPVSLYPEEALRGKLKALYIMGENPLMTEANLNQVKLGLQKLEFLVVQSIFLSETAEIADVVLPATAAYEKEGTFTNTDRTVQLLRPAKNPPRGTRNDWEIVCAVAQEMGYKMSYHGPAEIMDEIAQLTPSYQGITYERLKKGGLQWPCLDKKHPGTPYLYKDYVFKRKNSKALFHAVKYKTPSELPDKEYPFILTTGRILYHFHSGNETRRVKVLQQHVPFNYVEVNPVDAQRLKLNEGEMVKVKTRRGEIRLQVRISTQPKPGVIFIPFHFKEAAANILTNSALDPISKIPEFKVCAARIEK